jgi:hypothetical protein
MPIVNRPGKFALLKPTQRPKTRDFFPVNLPPEKTIEVLNPDKDDRAKVAG